MAIRISANFQKSDDQVFYCANFSNAQQQGEQVAVFGHYPLTKHSLMNAKTLVELLSSYNMQYCFFKHNHRDNVAQINQTGFYTMKRLLNGATDIPFAMVAIASGNVRINSCGGEISLTL